MLCTSHCPSWLSYVLRTAVNYCLPIFTQGFGPASSLVAPLLSTPPLPPLLRLPTAALFVSLRLCHVVQHLWAVAWSTVGWFPAASRRGTPVQACVRKLQLDVHLGVMYLIACMAHSPFCCPSDGKQQITLPRELVQHRHGCAANVDQVLQ